MRLHQKIRVNDSVVDCTLINAAILAELSVALRDLGKAPHLREYTRT
jgi:hypothetical protein